MKTLTSTFLLAFGLFALTYQPAIAAPVWKEGYVCNVQYLIQNNVAYGEPVFLVAAVRTASHCGGTDVFTAYLKHYGGTAKGHTFSRNELLAHLESLQQAAIHGTKVQFYLDDAPGSAVYSVTFFGN